MSQLGTLISWIIFLFALLLPTTELFFIKNDMVGSYTVTVPLIILFLARALDGITGGNVSVANAYSADITEDENRNTAYGKMAISSNTGFIIGPALAGLLGATPIGAKAPVLAAIFISILALAIIARFLPESKPCFLTANPVQSPLRRVLGQEQKDCYRVEDLQKLTLSEILALKQIRFYILLYFLIFLGFNFFYTAFPVHAQQRLEWSVTELGAFLSILSFMMIIIQGPVLSQKSKRVSERDLLIYGSILLGFNFLLLMAASNGLTYTAAIFFAVGNGLMWPSYLSLLSKAAEGENQGAIQGVASSAGSFASIVGLVIGGILYETLGVAVFAVSVGVFLVILVMSLKFKATKH